MFCCVVLYNCMFFISLLLMAVTHVHRFLFVVCHLQLYVYYCCFYVILPADKKNVLLQKEHFIAKYMLFLSECFQFFFIYISLVSVHLHVIFYCILVLNSAISNSKGGITITTKLAIKHNTSHARLAQLLQPSLAFCFS